MLQLKNALNQMLPINLRDGESIHLLANSIIEIEDDLVESPEIQMRIKKGQIRVIKNQVKIEEEGGNE